MSLPSSHLQGISPFVGKEILLAHPRGPIWAERLGAFLKIRSPGGLRSPDTCQVNQAGDTLLIPPANQNSGSRAWAFVIG
ncbi:hypothetical protein E2C01_050911 [Portunus trituberculatus]|uniref:Uncharacterized protein n=1 Tax=Portunus trituberculatus TaxID=210409 RepID=A0A5B7GHQ0_PORTR|nr:hypothetical protein [Portunus trituberculatus]